MSEVDFKVDDLDGVGCALYLEVDRTKIVLLHAIFEGHDGLGIIKTLDERRGLVCVLTTHDMLPNCEACLESLRSVISWRSVVRPDTIENLFTYVQVE